MAYYNEIEYTCYIRIDNVSVYEYVESVDLSFSEDDYVNQVTINFNVKGEDLFGTLCDPEINFGLERISIGIDSTSFDFLLEKRTSSIDSENISFSVWGRSKAALLDVPYANPFLADSTATIDIAANNYLASNIMSKVIGYTDLGGITISLQYDIEDFIVYGDQFITENKSAIQIINELAKVTGGRVRSDINGDLIVEYRPFSTAFTSPVIEYTDIDTVFQLDESIEHPPGYNRVRVLGFSPEDLAGAGATLNIELDDDYDQTCIVANQEVYIRIYPSPIDLLYTFDVTMGTFIHRGQYASTHTETINVLDGNSSVNYPINEITTSQWIGRDLGTFDHAQGYTNINVPTGGYGVLEITYTSLYDSYIFRSSSLGTILLYALEDIIEE